MWASSKDLKEAIKLLLDHRADKSARDKLSVTDMTHVSDVYACI